MVFQLWVKVGEKISKPLYGVDMADTTLLFFSATTSFIFLCVGIVALHVKFINEEDEDETLDAWGTPKSIKRKDQERKDCFAWEI